MVFSMPTTKCAGEWYSNERGFKIPPSTLTSILHRKDFIAATPSNSVKKRQKAGGFPELEKALVTWFSQCRQQNVPVSGILMKESEKLKPLIIATDEADEVEDDDRLLQNEENDVTFDDFVHCDDDVVVAEILTDNDIVCTATDEADEVEDDDEEELPTITFKEARTYIDARRPPTAAIEVWQLLPAKLVVWKNDRVGDAAGRCRDRTSLECNGNGFSLISLE
ncbi:Tc5 transposase DNA-binding domain [Popillia japonica]|uniref:Tc5 transposase DNA-binding domain n=1 Tax=Popillia japonica TaxID=7064 RepID=A0AAW1K213_POPJA